MASRKVRSWIWVVGHRKCIMYTHSFNGNVLGETYMCTEASRSQKPAASTAGGTLGSGYRVGVWGIGHNQIALNGLIGFFWDSFHRGS